MLKKVLFSSLGLLISFNALSQTEGENPVKAVTENVESIFDKLYEILPPTKIFSIILVLIFTWLLIKAISWGFDLLVKRFNKHRLRILRIRPILNVLIWIITILTLVVIFFDPSTTTLATIFGSSALALGFAAQDILKNIFGGFLILFDRPFQIGDRINVKGNYGEVKNIGIRNTLINTLDDNNITIPNSAIVSENVSNANAGALDCMVVVNLWLPISIDVKKIRKIAFEAATTSPYLNIDKPVNILFFDHFDKEPATNVKVKAYVFDARFEKAFEGDVTEAAKMAFRNEGIY